MTQAAFVKIEVDRIDLGSIATFHDGEDHSFAAMLDCGLVDRLVFYIQSTADQAVGVAVIGSEGDRVGELNAVVWVTGLETIPAGNEEQKMIAITVDLHKDWHPWMGLALTTSIGPSTGAVNASASYRQLVVQE